MKNKFISVLIFGFLIFGFLFSFVGAKIMIVEEDPNYVSDLKFHSSSVVHKTGVFNLSIDEIKTLKRDSSLIVREPYNFSIFLGDAVVQQNVSKTWNLQIDEVNLTGAKTSVCVIDTGIDSSHLDLNGKVLAQYCFCAMSNCCFGDVSESSNATDDNGHGTHVAGIIAAGGNLKGVGVGANLVIVKAMDETGSGREDDLYNAVEWCSNNAETYNITAISMSLGANCYYSNGTWTGSCYSDICDGVSFTLQNKINAAVAKNISVVIASGNDGNKTYISWPACLPDVTRVASIDKDDSTISSFSNINSLVKLLGVGRNVNSTMPTYEVYFNTERGYSEDYASISGTSMATPMISGAIAVLNQYLGMIDLTLNTSEIEDLLYSNGKKILYNGINYSRLDLYNSILSIDVDSPEVYLIDPINETISTNTNWSFSCNYSDWQLANATFRIWNSTGEIYNETNFNITGETNQTNLTLNNMPFDEYSWGCEVYDAAGNFNSSYNNTLIIGGISSSLISPANDNYTNLNLSNFTCAGLSEESHELVNATLYLWNSSGNLNHSETKDATSFYNKTSFLYNISSEGNYSWNCEFYNNNSNSSFAIENYTMTFDMTSPVISDLTESSIGSSGAVITWNTNESSNSSASKGTNSSSYVMNHSIAFSGLSASTTYSYTVWSCDKASNCANSSGSFQTSSAPSSGSSGGGTTSTSSTTSGGVAPAVIDTRLTETDLIEGITRSYKAGEKIKITLRTENHSITINEIGNGSVNITIESDPIKIELREGEDDKINVTSDRHYDLYLKLNGIEEGDANLTIKSIWEEIGLDANLTENEENQTYQDFDEVDLESSGGFILLGGVVFVVVMAAILVIVVFGVKKDEPKDKKTKKTSKKDGSKEKK